MSEWCDPPAYHHAIRKLLHSINVWCHKLQQTVLNIDDFIKRIFPLPFHHPAFRNGGWEGGVRMCFRYENGMEIYSVCVLNPLSTLKRHHQYVPLPAQSNPNRGWWLEIWLKCAPYMAGYGLRGRRIWLGWEQQVRAEIIMIQQITLHRSTCHEDNYILSCSVIYILFILA